ncbi:MAG: type II toxin-antitoxin system Phd/YefM family antitoxin [Candidatus Levyibacteriota bacterium]
MTYTLPITKAMLEKAKKKPGGIIITVDGKPSAVLMSMEEYREYESLKETEEILADKKLVKDIREAEEDIKAGHVYDWEDVKKELKWNVSDSTNKKSKKKV